VELLTLFVNQINKSTRMIT